MLVGTIRKESESPVLSNDEVVGEAHAPCDQIDAVAQVGPYKRVKASDATVSQLSYSDEEGEVV